MKNLKQRFAAIFVILIILVVSSMQQLFIQKASAVPFLTQADIMYSRMQASTSGVTATVFFKGSTSIGTVNKLVVTLGAATISNGACTVNTTGLPTNPTNTALPGSLSCNASSNVVTITSITTGLSSSTLYAVNITGLTTQSAGTYSDVVSTYVNSTQEEATTVGSDIISNDQITVSATVNPTFTLTFGATSDAFTAALASSSVGHTTGVSITAVTNAANGWTAWVADSNTGLTSTLASHNIASPSYSSSSNSTATAGTERYLVSAQAGTGSPSLDTGYSGNGTTTGGGVSPQYQRISYGTGPTSQQIFSLTEVAAISGSTPPASDYADTITVVGSGNF